MEVREIPQQRLKQIRDFRQISLRINGGASMNRFRAFPERNNCHSMHPSRLEQTSFLWQVGRRGGRLRAPMHDWTARHFSLLALVVRRRICTRRPGYRGIGTASCTTGPPNHDRAMDRTKTCSFLELCTALSPNILSLMYECIYPAPRLTLPLLLRLPVSDLATSKPR
jgi:hypothetical protein